MPGATSPRSYWMRRAFGIQAASAIAYHADWSSQPGSTSKTFGTWARGAKIVATEVPAMCALASTQYEDITTAYATTMSHAGSSSLASSRSRNRHRGCLDLDAVVFAERRNVGQAGRLLEVPPSLELTCKRPSTPRSAVSWCSRTARASSTDFSARSICERFRA
jgi:hypothetical protein